MLLSAGRLFLLLLEVQSDFLVGDLFLPHPLFTPSERIDCTGFQFSIQVHDLGLTNQYILLSPLLGQSHSLMVK